MPRVLIQFAHPALEGSRSPSAPPGAAAAASRVSPSTTSTRRIPTFDIDVAREQALLVAHDVIVFQHPFYWYCTPPLLKEWQDLVLEHGWAYGRAARALRGKQLLHVITTGGREEAYQHEGYNRFTIRELLAPLEQTAHLCGMRCLAAVRGPRHASDDRARRSHAAARRVPRAARGAARRAAIDLGRVTGHPDVEPRDRGSSTPRQAA